MRIVALLIFTSIMSLQVFAEEKDKDKEILELKQKVIKTGQTLKIEQIPNLYIDLKSPTNWYLLLLPFITISYI